MAARSVAAAGPPVSLSRDSVQVVLQPRCRPGGNCMQIVVVTGASSGIGRAVVARFGRDGAAVLAVGRSGTALQEMAQEDKRSGVQCVPFKPYVTAANAPATITARAVPAF